ncbi:unnamed protein product [Timema podura]|uniref:Uncharacterized protein n=1 Tax=Timema podura TaxID=61482 RepID=A0ABN7P160_TIMPD|nr:unnamed protein product [Timema podura]
MYVTVETCQMLACAKGRIALLVKRGGEGKEGFRQSPRERSHARDESCVTGRTTTQDETDASILVLIDVDSYSKLVLTNDVISLMFLSCARERSLKRRMDIREGCNSPRCSASKATVVWTEPLERTVSNGADNPQRALELCKNRKFPPLPPDSYPLYPPLLGPGLFALWAGG